jgi:gamma-glutamyltranspeptidase/glutathione hydrolase
MASMMVCPEPPAAEVGGLILARGGNAADAAVGAAFAQGVTNPLLCGLSGTAILMHVEANGRPTVLNGECETGSGAVPAGWISGLRGRSEMIGRFIIDGEPNQLGATSVMVPGFVATCWELFNRFGSGKLRWAELLEPAIRLAADGFAIYPYIVSGWVKGDDGQGSARPGYPTLRQKFAHDPAAAAIYMKPDGSGYELGDVLRQPAYAATLDQLARAGARDFYAGAVGRAMAEDLARRGSLVQPADLANYRVVEQQALRGTYRGDEILTTPPPSPGVQLLQMLGILERVGVGPWRENDRAGTIAPISAVMRAGFLENRDIKAVLLDEADAWADRVLDAARLDAWAARIRSGDLIDGSVSPAGMGTTHLVAVDEGGAIVTFTHSVGSVAGSGAVTPELGFLHNNFLGHFDPRPGRQMSILPGRRIGSGLPTVTRRDGRSLVTIGAPGGSRIITSVLQTLIHFLDHELPIDEAVSQLRFHSEEALLLHLEPGWDDATAERLRASGLTVQSNAYQARVQAIAFDASGTPKAGADPRGGAVGVGRAP